jgi:hypothetical protein
MGLYARRRGGSSGLVVPAKVPSLLRKVKKQERNGKTEMHRS